MECQKCARTGPDGEEHYHTIVEGGRVTRVWYVSASGYWDRELERSEYFAEYKEEWLKPSYITENLCVSLGNVIV
jgi:hypothetical protein